MFLEQLIEDAQLRFERILKDHAADHTPPVMIEKISWGELPNVLKSDGCKANDQRHVPLMAVPIQLGGKILDTKNDAQTAPPAYNREVATPTDSPGGPSAWVYPVSHSASPMR
jgi:hypothetical protein